MACALTPPPEEAVSTLKTKHKKKITAERIGGHGEGGGGHRQGFECDPGLKMMGF